jgi:hypothetical protein
LCTKISQTLPRLLECSPTRRPYWGSRPGWRRSAASQHMCSDCDGSPSVRGQGPLRGRGRGRGRGGGRSRRERGAACAPGGATGRADGADGADRLPAPADAGEATAAQKSKKPRSIAFAKMPPSYRRTRGDEAIATHLYHAFRGTNVCTFVPHISSAPFFWGVIASFDRVYTSSSAPQCERNVPPRGPFLRSSWSQPPRHSRALCRQSDPHLYVAAFSRGLYTNRGERERSLVIFSALWINSKESPLTRTLCLNKLLNQI